MVGVVGATQPTTADARAVDAAALGAAGAASLAHPANVSISNQISGGTTVVVDEVYVVDGGFVTVHDATVTKGGAETFSSVLGTSTYLESGVQENVTVTLDQPITNGSTLVAMLHRGTDGDRSYDFVSSNGQDDGPYVFTDEIVADTASVTGTAIPMLHRDTDGDQTYDFVTSGGAGDGPHTNTREDSPAGAIVVAAAEVTVGMGDTDTATETMADDDQPTPDGSSDDGAGFGLVAALLAVVALALLARRG